MATQLKLAKETVLGDDVLKIIARRIIASRMGDPMDYGLRGGLLTAEEHERVEKLIDAATVEVTFQ